MNRSLGRLYASEGRPSIPPEQLLSALLLQVFYGIRSERQLMEQLDYNLLYRWFVGLSPDDPVWDPTTFTKNRERLQNGEHQTSKLASNSTAPPQQRPDRIRKLSISRFFSRLLVIAVLSFANSMSASV